MPADWALEIMRKAPYITVSFTRPDGTAYGVPLSLDPQDPEREGHVRVMRAPPLWVDPILPARRAHAHRLGLLSGDALVRFLPPEASRG